MADKTTAATDSKSSLSAQFEETPWVAQDRTVAEPDPTEAALVLLSEAAHHSFRLEPLQDFGILVSRF
jgi:hypothetical protein